MIKTHVCEACGTKHDDPEWDGQALRWLCGICDTWQATIPIENDKAGLKHDGGKIKPRLIIEGFPRALSAVAEVATFGANKYTEDGWVTVPDGIKRYTDAKYRHALAEAEGEELDAESKLKHAAHEAWNTLARLELMLREEEKNGV